MPDQQSGQGHNSDSVDNDMPVMLQNSTNSCGSGISLQMKGCCRRAKLGLRQNRGLRQPFLQGIKGHLTVIIPCKNAHSSTSSGGVGQLSLLNGECSVHPTLTAYSSALLLQSAPHS